MILLSASGRFLAALKREFLSVSGSKAYPFAVS